MQGVRAPGLSFPQALTEFIAGGMASSAPAERTSAHSLGSAALQQVDGQLPDSQSALLLTAAWQEVTHMTVHSSSAMAAVPIPVTAVSGLMLVGHLVHRRLMLCQGRMALSMLRHQCSVCHDVRCFHAFAGCICRGDPRFAGVAGQPAGGPAESGRAACQNAGAAVGAVSQKRCFVPGEPLLCQATTGHLHI